MPEFRSSRHHREILLADWRDAEELASWYMRESLGMKGARVTGLGNDGGIDVIAEGGVAQVKHLNVPVGAPVVQAALGAGHGNDAVLFFALSGYTRQAEEFAGRAGVCLFQYDIYGEVRAGNEPARRLAANRNNAGTMSVQDVRMNELRAKAVPALSKLEDARNKVAALARSLEGTTGLEDDNETLAFIVGEYAGFLAEPGAYGALGSYDQALAMIETAWADEIKETRLGRVRFSKGAVDAGFGDLIKLHEELNDLDRLRPMTAAQWVRKLFDWEFRRNRIKYLTQYAHYQPMGDEPSLEAFELRAVIDMNSGGKFNYPIATRWLTRPFVSAPEDLAICFAAAQKDPIDRGADYCLGLLENFLGMDFDEDEDEPLPAHPLGWSRQEIDRLRGLVA